MHPTAFTIPPHRAFADALAAGLIAMHGRDRTELARGIVLVPNNRAARAIQDAFVRRSGDDIIAVAVARHPARWERQLPARDTVIPLPEVPLNSST